MSDGERLREGSDEDALERIESVLSRHPVSFAMVFGSVAHGTMRSESDIDLAVEFDDLRPEDDGYSDAYLGLRSDLNAAVEIGVDVVDVHSMTARFARTAFDTGDVIHGSERRRDELERDVATETASVADARERVAAAVTRLREGQ